MLMVSLCAVALAACGGGSDPGSAKPDLADQDRFLKDYVQLLNASNENGLAGLLDAHPQGDKDARARINAYGGKGWDVRWTRQSEFANVWKVEIVGTAGAKNRPVHVTETVAWENAHWVMAPLPGVAPTPSAAAGTEPPH
ncbi:MULTISPECIES: hypothetical protein [Streptomyces]|uniref:hypothetical protein n=1 Tax=Streptomyces TaxID=1883 RepID=UPI0004C17B44|nr:MULTISPECIES: hypothetical protein [Streptomyces]MBD3545995.1 hypothetical protein [Streptomyces sp. JV180]MDW4914713.1 hypothetical protein [Streptomyces californicus]